jgi:capsular exopolysaccharide synthesis family protein
VILVDADLRKPSLHYMFDMQIDPGFTNLVLDQSSAIEDFLRPTNVENLRVLTCGIIPPNPAELLGSPRAAVVMEQLAAYADIVVYDSPPAATVVDAVVMGPRVDAVLHVIHAGKTRIDLVRRCKALLERGGAHILGPVLNQVSLPELRSYSYYYSYSYKQANGKRSKRSKGAPSKAKISSNGATVRSK